MKLIGILGAAALAMCASSAANAAVTVNIHPSGSNVVAQTSGSLDLTGLTLDKDLFYLQAGTQGSDGYVGTGAGSHQFPADPITTQQAYSGFTGPSSFGSGTFTYADSGSGNAFAFNASLFSTPFAFVPNGYVSGAALSSSATFLGQTIAGLGLTPGSYVYSSGTDSVTINVSLANVTPAPEPATWAMMLIGFGVVGASMRIGRRSVRFAYS
jgi:hypothetical protein